MLWVVGILGPMYCFGLADCFQTRHTIRRNFPFIGRARYWFEAIRPEINQYFVESNSDGMPFSREQRSVVYQRAKKTLDSLPFGTQKDVYSVGYEWVKHSIYAKHLDPKDFRVRIGGPECSRPYNASLLNVSGLSYGALSAPAIMALGGGALDGRFALNTGEGGVSPYHLKYGCDLIWQLGTGYFGCRDKGGNFCAAAFADTAQMPEIKMIEIKISQGAKPSHGGLLPKAKITPEIARIRGVGMEQDVLSPPTHSAFSSPKELVEFVARIRRLAQGKPVGIKLCIGQESEFVALVKAMRSLGSFPDYIAVDGGEGGTGAAPLEFANNMGWPGVEALVFAKNCLEGFGVKQHVKLVASGKVSTGFGLVKRLCLGADAVYAARSFMLALGCIQALRCHANTCPTGIATQKSGLTSGLVVVHKRDRVKNYHQETMESTAHIIGAMGLENVSQLRPWHVMRRVSINKVQHYGELYDFVNPGAWA